MNFIVCGWQVRSLIILLCTLFWFNIETFYWKTFVLDWIQVFLELCFDVQFRLALFLRTSTDKSFPKGEKEIYWKFRSWTCSEYDTLESLPCEGNELLLRTRRLMHNGETIAGMSSYCWRHLDWGTLLFIGVFERGTSCDSSLVITDVSLCRVDNLV